jgi:hypothetical protein
VADTLDSGGAQSLVEGLAVTPSFFPLLWVRPARGRLFAAFRNPWFSYLQE